MANPFYNATGYPADSSFGSSADMRSELALAGAGFDAVDAKLGTDSMPSASRTGKGGTAVRVKLDASGLEASNNTIHNIGSNISSITLTRHVNRYVGDRVDGGSGRYSILLLVRRINAIDAITQVINGTLSIYRGNAGAHLKCHRHQLSAGRAYQDHHVRIFGAVGGQVHKVMTVTYAGLSYYAVALGLQSSDSLYFDGDVGSTNNDTNMLRLVLDNEVTITEDGSLAEPIGSSANILVDLNGNFYSAIDNNANALGLPAKRWSQVFAATGAINTSDAREKTVVAPLTVNEIAAAKALASEIGSFQYLSAVASKGEGARTHIGLTVQRAIEIMTAHGLNPFRYAFICHDQWDEQPGMPSQSGEGNENALSQPTLAGDRYGFRADQLALFIARGFEARLAALEKAA